ncbi:uncharacterized protein LOC131656795 isoform X4 [Vicia villosa]|uniref:uncharacterized protein LOC131656795 isoform X4 n=1 Tax=Vicia villosa TaxID=3911 RepID=UPI00273B64C0|nr:uncharacterized protein LOC131656795 isoform X4 [Vicia villosa]
MISGSGNLLTNFHLKGASNHPFRLFQLPNRINHCPVCLQWNLCRILPCNLRKPHLYGIYKVIYAANTPKEFCKWIDLKKKKKINRHMIMNIQAFWIHLMETMKR